VTQRFIRDLQGVSQGKIEHEVWLTHALLHHKTDSKAVNFVFQVFDERAYYEKTCQLLEYTRRYLTVTAMASYVLETMGYPNVAAMTIKPKVLLIQGDWIYPDYQADLITIGMRKVHTYTLRAVYPWPRSTLMFYTLCPSLC
jgi:hypothetical protein